MNRKAVHRQRRQRRDAKLRRRDALLGAASLMTHLVVFLLLPGLVVYADQPRKLVVRLELPTTVALPAADRSAEADSTAAPVAAPATREAAVRDDDLPVASLPPLEAPGPRPVEEPVREDTPAAVEAAEATSGMSAADSAPAETKPVPRDNEATSISSVQPLAVPGERAQVPPPPSGAEPAAPGQPDAREEVGAGEAEADATHELAVEESAAEEQEGGANGAPGGHPDTEEGPGTGPASDDAADTTADTAGSPPGPTARDLELLAEYADAARRRIRSQARNPEQGGAGTVTFEFEVARDGHLVDVAVIRSSGYSNIDNDVVEATRAAFNERREKLSFPAEVTVASWVFVMSLEYPLY